MLGLRRGGWLVLVLAWGTGCSIAPKNFRNMGDPAPLVRARAVGLGRGLPGGVAIPALIDRLNDSDQVVQLSANEELKRRTGQDFGFVPWADKAEQGRAIARWKAWHSGRKPSGLSRSSFVRRRSSGLSRSARIP
ncbi:MAG: hypothetical protein ABI353_24095 [Isosphaeraceae bacterium]